MKERKNITSVLLILLVLIFCILKVDAIAKNGMYIELRSGDGIVSELNAKEIEIYSNNTNIALNANAEASSYYDTAFMPEKVIDGIKTDDNFWASAGKENEWLKISLDQEMPIERIIIYPRKNFEDRLNNSVLTIYGADNSIVYSEEITELTYGSIIDIKFAISNIPMTETLEERREELSPFFENLPPAYFDNNGVQKGYDLAYCMPIGSGTVTSLLHYGDDYNIKLGKSDFYSIDGPGLEYQWVDKVHSPGLVHLSFGIPRSDISSFKQKLDLNRGSVIMTMKTPDGDIKVESYGVMGKDSMIYEITDTRTVKNISATYTIWRPVDEPDINEIAINAENSQITVKEVHKYYKVDNNTTDKRVLPNSPSNVKDANLYYHLGVGTCIAFADANGILTSTTIYDPTVNPAEAKIETVPTSDKYYLIITVSTSYDLAPENKAQTVMNAMLNSDKDMLQDDNINYWQNFWQNSYIDLYGTGSDKPLQAWYTGLYNYAVTTNSENPANFNGTGFIVYKDQMQWGASRYWQNNREIMWIMGAAGKNKFFKDYLMMYDEYFNDSKSLTSWIGKIGIKMIEAPKSKKINLPPVPKKVSSFNESLLKNAIENHDYENNTSLGASVREFNQAAELTQQMFDYVEFTGDTDFMNSVAIPWLKEAALFYLSLLRKEHDEYYHLMLADSLETYRMVGDPTPDTAGMRYLFAMILKNGDFFGYEPDFIEVVRDRFEHLAPLKKAYWQSGSNYLNISDAPKNIFFDDSDAFLEQRNTYAPAGFMNPVDETDPYRSFNGENPELYLVYPFAIFDANSGHDEYCRALRTLNNRANIFPYSWDQSPIQAARLHLNSTFEYIITHNNKFQLYPYGGWESCCSHLEHTSIDRISVTPFFDAMGVALTSLQEMLLQSHHPTDSKMKYSLTGGDGIINIIPAVNDNMAGRFKLHARGGFTVETEFQTSKRIQKIKITASRLKTLKIKNPFTICTISKNGKMVNDAEQSKIIELAAETGDVFEFTPADATKAAITVSSNGINIPNGINEAYFDYNTIFTSFEVGARSTEHTFTITNKGTEDLILDSDNPFEISGEGKDCFTITLPDNITNPIHPYGKIEFSIIFNARFFNKKSAEIIIHSNTDDFSFRITGKSIYLQSAGNDNLKFPNNTKFAYLPALGILKNDLFMPVVSPEINLLKAPYKDVINTKDGSVSAILWKKQEYKYSTTNTLNMNSKISDITISTSLAPKPQFYQDFYVVKKESVLNVPVEYGLLSNDYILDNVSVKVTEYGDAVNFLVNKDGSFQYTAPADFTGKESFLCKYKSNGSKSYAYVYFKVVDDETEIPPLTLTDKYTIENNNFLQVSAEDGILKNDWDSYNRDITAELYSKPQYGKVQLNPDGSFKYIAKPGFFGYDLFSYRADNGFKKSMPVSVVIYLPLPADEAGNDLNESAYSQTFYLPADMPVDIPAEKGILNNVISNYGDNLYLDHITSTDGDGSENLFSITEKGALSSPVPLTKTLTFECIIKTGRGIDFSKHIILVPFEDGDSLPPTTKQDSYNCLPNSTLQITAEKGVLANDENAAAIDTYNIEPTQHGQITVNDDGSFIYTPAQDFNGVDKFFYKALTSDGEKSSNTLVSINVYNQHPQIPPEGNDDFYSFVSGISFSADELKGILSNDKNNSFDFELNTALVSEPAHGTLTLNPNGSFDYSPDPEFTGEDSFVYYAYYNSTVPEQQLKTENTIVVIKIKDETQNIAPNVENDLYSTVKNQIFSINSANGVLANDSDPDNDLISVTDYTQPQNGTVKLNPDGSFKFTPNTDFVGQDFFKYTAGDHNGKANEANVYIKVNQTDFKPEDIDSLYYMLNETNCYNEYKMKLSYPGDKLYYWGSIQNPSSDYSMIFNNTESLNFPSLTLENSKLMLKTSGATLTNSKNDLYDGTIFIVAKEYSQDQPHDILDCLTRGSNAILDDTDWNLPDSLKARLDGADIDPYVVDFPLNHIFLLTLTFESEYLRAGNINNWNGTYGEIIVYDRKLQQHEIEQVENYLAEKWLVDNAYYLQVRNGSGSGSYQPDTMVAISAPEFNPDGLLFDSWSGNTEVIENIHQRENILTMPHKNINLIPLYKPAFNISGNISGDISAFIQVSLSGDTHQSVLTDSKGNFTFTNVSQGNYTVNPVINGKYTIQPPEQSCSVGIFPVNKINFTTTADISPEAADDFYSLTINTELKIFAQIGVLTNDSYPYDSVNAVVVSNPIHGTLSFNPDGSFSYTPETDYIGEDSFSYKFYSRDKESNEASVHMTVTENIQTSFAVSGHITGLTSSNVTVKITGDSLEKSVQSNNTGLYYFTDIQPGNYTITPMKAGYSFNPELTMLTITDSNLINIDFSTSLKQGISNHITYNNKDYFFNAVNIPWNIKGKDFGENDSGESEYNEEWFENTFTELESAKINCVRIFLHFDGRISPVFDENGFATGLPSDFFNNFDSFLEIAENHKIMVIPVLFSYEMLSDNTEESGQYAGNHADLITDPDKLDSYIQNALIPMIEHYKHTPNIPAFEIIDEPELGITELNPVTDTTVSLKEMQNFCALTANTIHELSNKMVTIGSASIKYLSDIPPATGNLWSDQALSDASETESFVDFYNLHFTTGDDDFNPFNPAQSVETWQFDKKVIIGSFIPPEDTNTLEACYTFAPLNGYAGLFSWSYKTMPEDAWTTVRENHILIAEKMGDHAEYPGKLKIIRIFPETLSIDAPATVTVTADSGFDKNTVLIIDGKEQSFDIIRDSEIAFTPSAENYSEGDTADLYIALSDGRTVYTKDALTFKKLYTLTVTHGTGSDSYFEGESVEVTADEIQGATFEYWLSDDDFYIENRYSSTTNISMPAYDTTLRALYSGMTYSVSGNVENAPSEGVHITISGPGFHQTEETDENGNFIFDSVPDGDYTLTPSLDWYEFSPDSEYITVDHSNVEGISFTAAEQSYQPPVPVGDSYEVISGDSLSVSRKNGVMANDLIIFPEKTVAYLDATVKYGNLDFKADGSFVYTPDTAMNSTEKDSFTYHLFDTREESKTVSVKILLKPRKVSVGSIVTVNASDLPLYTPGFAFDKTPKVYAEILSTGKNTSLKKVKGSNPKQVQAVWKKRITLYDKKSVKNDYQSVEYSQQDLLLQLKVKGSYQKSKFDSPAYKLYLTAPLITDFTFNGNNIMIKGKYFGTKAPKILLAPLGGGGKSLKCKVDKRSYQFNPENGNSSVRATVDTGKIQYPDYYLIIDNKVGIGLNENGKLPVVKF